MVGLLVLRIDLVLQTCGVNKGSCCTVDGGAGGGGAHLALLHVTVDSERETGRMPGAEQTQGKSIQSW